MGELQTIWSGIIAGLTEWKNCKNSGIVDAEAQALADATILHFTSQIGAVDKAIALAIENDFRPAIETRSSAKHRCRQTTTLRLCLRALKHVGDLHRRPRSAAGCRDAAGVQGAGRRPLVAHSRTAFACDRKQTRSALRRRSGNGFGQPAAIGSCRTRDGRRQEPRRSVCRKSAAAGPRNPKSRSEQPERHSRRIEQARYRTARGKEWTHVQVGLVLRRAT